MLIELLGTGCSKCARLETLVRSTAERLGVECEIAHVRDIGEIVQRGVMAPPALIVDGRVVVSGRLPNESEVAAWLTEAAR